MPTFEEFVQTELPTRPFVATDGAAGQVLMRSSNPLAVRELTWGDVPGVGAPTSHVQLEAGQDMAAGTPVKVVANVFVPAGTNDPHVLGLLRSAAIAGQTATAQSSGTLTLTGLTPGAFYYLGDGSITATPPTSGYLVLIGSAITASMMAINLAPPIYLA